MVFGWPLYFRELFNRGFLEPRELAERYGKLFVSALTPLAFLVLLRAVRGGVRWAYGAFAVVPILIMLVYLTIARKLGAFDAL